MAKPIHLISSTDEKILSKIYLIRGQKVMIDRDLAILYEVETKRLKESVRRNKIRFPKDFMFEMNKREFENWRTQFASSNDDKVGLRHAPFCFTEHGVTMLSCILNSERAVQVNIQIIRLFAKMKEMLMANKDIMLQLQKIEVRLTAHDEDLKVIFNYLKQLINPPQEPRERIGFKP